MPLFADGKFEQPYLHALIALQHELDELVHAQLCRQAIRLRCFRHRPAKAQRKAENND